MPELEDKLSTDVKSTLVYIAGYVARKDDSDFGTYTYFEKYGLYTATLDRGGLSIPNDTICQWVYFSYILFSFVAQDVCRISLCDILMDISHAYNFGIEERERIVLANIFVE